MPFVSGLQLLLIALKLLNHIDWSWFWVLCPLWATPIVWFLNIFLGAAAYCIVRR